MQEQQGMMSKMVRTKNLTWPSMDGSRVTFGTE